MSTQTLRKRIALVAVASLGFGLMSTVPASAGIGNITGGTVTVQTVTAQPTSEFKIPFTLTTTAEVAAAATAGVTITAVSVPTGGIITCSAAVAGTYSTGNCSTANTVYEFLANAAAADAKLHRSSGDTKIVTGYIYAKVNKPGTYTVTVGVVADSATPGTALTATSANASFTLGAVNSVPTYTNTTTTIAGRVGQQVSIPVTANIAAIDLSGAPVGEYQVIGTAAASHWRWSCNRNKCCCSVSCIKPK